MLIKTNIFWITYQFDKRILDICKGNAMTLKMLIMSNTYWYILKKSKVETLASDKTALSTKSIVDKKKVDVSIWKMSCTIN